MREEFNVAFYSRESGLDLERDLVCINDTLTIELEGLSLKMAAVDGKYEALEKEIGTLEKRIVAVQRSKIGWNLSGFCG